MQLAWVVPLGLLVGLALGSLGGGGSILTVPALVYLLGQSPAAATTGSLIIVGLTSLVGMTHHLRRGNVRLGQGLTFGVLGTVGSYAGSRLAAGVPAPWLLSAFSVLMLVVAVLMGTRLRHRTVHAHPLNRSVHPARVVLAATAVGLLTGFFGVGGGFAVVPALVLALGLSMPIAIGTSLLVIAINSATALASRIGTGLTVDWTTIGAFAAVAAIGSLIGARVAARLPHRTLTIAFITMLVAVGLYMAASNIPHILP
jgi:uncharacterized membrane protein YfcA